MAGPNPFGSSGGAKQETSSGGGSSKPSISLETPPRPVVDFMVAAIEGQNGLAEWPVFDEDAVAVEELLEADIPEDVKELLEAFPDSVENLSIESFFSVDLQDKGIEYVGTPPLIHIDGDEEQFQELPEDVLELYEDEDIYKYGKKEKGLKSYIPDPDWVELVREDKVGDDVIYEISTLLNGYYLPLLTDKFYQGEPIKWGVGVGRNHNHQTEDGEPDEFEKRRNVSFAPSDGKSAADSSVTAMKNVGTIDKDTYEDWDDGELDYYKLVQDVRDEIPE